jgi:hypothetical protein
MVLAGDKLFVAGPPDVIPDDDPTAAFEGRRGGDLWAFSAETGKKIAEINHTHAPPVYDGLIAAQGSLYLSTTDGTILCFRLLAGNMRAPCADVCERPTGAVLNRGCFPLWLAAQPP